MSGLPFMLLLLYSMLSRKLNSVRFTFLCVSLKQVCAINAGLEVLPKIDRKSKQRNMQIRRAQSHYSKNIF